MKKILLVLVATVVLAPVASAGGFATVGLSSLPPDHLEAGAVWAVDVTILQHGVTPLENVQPVVRLTDANGAAGGEFAATPTSKPGVYHAEIRFPAAGTWRYAIDDGFTQTHTFKPVEVGRVATPSSFPALPVGGIALAVAFATALALFLRRTRSAPQPARLQG